MSVVTGRLVALFTALLASASVHAYIGPGAGLSAIGSVLAFFGALLLMIVGFVWYPVKRLLKRMKADPPPAELNAEIPEIDDSEQQRQSNRTQLDKS